MRGAFEGFWDEKLDRIGIFISVMQASILIGWLWHLGAMVFLRVYGRIEFSCMMLRLFVR